jgi:hypothetical protein
LLGIWWGCWLIAGQLGSFLLRRVLNEPTELEQLKTYYYALLASDVLLVPTAVLASIVVWQFTRSQEAAAAVQTDNFAFEHATPQPSGAAQVAALGLFVAALAGLSILAARSAPDAGFAFGEQREAASGPWKLSDAGNYLQIGDAVPGLQPVSARDLQLSKAEIGLDDSFSDVSIFANANMTQLVYMFMTTTSGSIATQAIKTELRDQAYLEREFIRGFIQEAPPNTPRPIIEWSDPGIGDVSKLGRLRTRLQEQGVTVEFSMELVAFVEERGTDGVAVFLFYMSMPPDNTPGEATAAAKAVLARLCAAAPC